MNGLSRRDLLHAFLGASSLSLLHCKATKERSIEDIDGAFALHREKRGHSLRDLRSLPSPTTWRDSDVVIVGGGVSGLAAAARLRAAGTKDIHIVELGDSLGGTAQGGSVSGMPCPWGAHYITVPDVGNTELVSLLESMDALEGKGENGRPIVKEELLCADPSERLYYRGRWYEGLFPAAGASRQTLAELAVFEAEVERLYHYRDELGRPAFALPMARCSTSSELRDLDSISFSTWMERKGIASERMRWWLEYACRDDYGSLLGQTSAWAGLFYFVARRMRAKSEYQEVITWPEGNGRLVNYLSAKADAKVLSETFVASIRNVGNLVEIVAIRGDEVIGLRAAHAVVAVPQFIAGRIVSDLSPERKAEALAVTQSPWLVANIVLKKRPAGVGFPLAWDNVLYDSPALGYVVATHQSGPSTGPTTLTYYFPLSDADPKVGRKRLLSLSWAQWCEVILADLSRAHPELRRHVERIDIARWGHAMVRSTPGSMFGGARARASEPVGRVFFAHSDLSGMPLFEEAFYRGNRAADMLLSRIREEAM